MYKQQANNTTWACFVLRHLTLRLLNETPRNSHSPQLNIWTWLSILVVIPWERKWQSVSQSRSRARHVRCPEYGGVVPNQHHVHQPKTFAYTLSTSRYIRTHSRRSCCNCRWQPRSWRRRHTHLHRTFSAGRTISCQSYQSKAPANQDHVHRLRYKQASLCLWGCKDNQGTLCANRWDHWDPNSSGWTVGDNRRRRRVSLPEKLSLLFCVCDTIDGGLESRVSSGVDDDQCQARSSCAEMGQCELFSESIYSASEYFESMP